MESKKIIIGIALIGALVFALKKPSREKKENIIKSNPSGLLKDNVSLSNLSDDEINLLYEDSLKFRKNLEPSSNFVLLIKKYNLT